MQLLSGRVTTRISHKQGYSANDSASLLMRNLCRYLIRDDMIFFVTSRQFVYDFFYLVCQELLPKFQISCIISIDKKNGYVRLTAEVEMMNMVTDVEIQTFVPQIPNKFLALPLAERRQKMAEQAQELMAHYIEETPERQDWQAGDFRDK